MPQPQDDLVARASDPNAELKTLHELANNYPGLRPYIAENPRTYPALLEWLAALGDPAVDAALARRNAAAATQAISVEQAQAAARAAAADSAPAQGGATGQLPADDSAGLTQALPTGGLGGQGQVVDPVAPTQAISQAEVARPAAPERRPIMEGRQAAAATPTAPTAAYGYQQPQQAAYQQPPQQTAYQQPQQAAYQQPPQQTAYQQPSAYQQAGPQATGTQAAAGSQGVFGVGTPEVEAQPRRSNLWLWILGGIALVLVVALIVWYLSSDHGASSSDPATAPAQAVATQAPATAPAQAGSTPSSTPSPTSTQNLVAPAPDGALEMSAFTTPSGNISCVLGEDAVSCTVDEHDFVPADASCNNSSDQAFTVSVTTEGEAQGSCGLAFSSAGASLNYGASAKNDSFACTSNESGIECWSQVSGKGFRLSRSNSEAANR
ncbi:hypothetical protein GZ998_06675 [Actinomyces sp. 594]|uniref:variant leucine-rich repeat-containing protein n=1 Tax=Actinomyces sp. 594 TaxID=2057793 RepID=UPI001C5942B3|nr:hypothetical protein [Actinomyces sp. 594]MBW3069187.1 hypothetical protein [Actinomyces sp. 594]